ncbi:MULTISPECIES: sugar phosphate isomerase/epimerase [unclassified Paenibacillus]|uniref:sugar phosphate isomerase/epimerase family protein n=1 Tax=unclassified Paenibacillus TaxID=185978 RepID=UPI00278AD4B9|nr:MULTISPECIES: TIM barrel protein [unclassified Paenibacillus]MDQ0898917.1 sugar phosphate isomerase/epimerase [Paenibacillus sp. V4I7]MDQ0915098.1 sugar phosphate isomerase/epimerase [Paenibacillus sp. V4I5]
MPFLSLTSWSLHRNLGPLRWTRWDENTRTQITDIQDQPELNSLLELPAVLSKKGFRSLEVCHFHFPNTSEEYLQGLKQAFTEADLQFYTLLIEYGDISSSDELRRQSDIAWIKGWIDIAARAGAERVRVIAGDAEPMDLEALKRSVDAFRELSCYAAEQGVRVVTENFHSLTSIADNCLALLEGCGELLGLTSDFGNFKGSEKYGELVKTIPHSESIHAKAQTNADGYPDEAEFNRCMEIAKQAGYEGPITLVYDGPGDMWEGIERVRKLATPYLN